MTQVDIRHTLKYPAGSWFCLRLLSIQWNTVCPYISTRSLSREFLYADDLAVIVESKEELIKNIDGRTEWRVKVWSEYE